jgi:hypothetical protein
MDGGHELRPSWQSSGSTAPGTEALCGAGDGGIGPGLVWPGGPKPAARIRLDGWRATPRRLRAAYRSLGQLERRLPQHLGPRRAQPGQRAARGTKPPGPGGAALQQPGRRLAGVAVPGRGEKAGDASAEGVGVMKKCKGAKMQRRNGLYRVLCVSASLRLNRWMTG